MSALPSHFDFIAAVDENWGLGRDGKIPWSNTAAGAFDMKHFRKITKDATVIMGRRTWESIGSKPLPDRENIVVSSTARDEYPHHATSLDAALRLAENVVTRIPSTMRAEFIIKNNELHLPSTKRNIFIIGGAELYREAIGHPRVRYGYITKIPGRYSCDVYFPHETLVGFDACAMEHKFLWPITGSYSKNTYMQYLFPNTDERRYQKLLRGLLHAHPRPNRTGIYAASEFHKSLRFNLWDVGRRARILPLLTCKRIPFAAVYHELIWFIRGDTNTSYLEEHGVGIWRGNSSREFLDARGLTDYSTGDVGPIYGAQWRGNYATNDEHRGRDQLAEVVEALKIDPWSRRHVVSAWNVELLNKMVLPPCHLMYQFHVATESSASDIPAILNCHVTMRSADLALGVPFNIASYALLTHIVSFLAGLRPGTLALTMVDCHLYQNHFEGARRMSERTARRFPTLRFSQKILGAEDIELDHFAREFSIDDYIVEGYDPHPAIKLTMAV